MPRWSPLINALKLAPNVLHLTPRFSPLINAARLTSRTFKVCPCQNNTPPRPTPFSPRPYSILAHKRPWCVTVRHVPRTPRRAEPAFWGSVLLSVVAQTAGNNRRRHRVARLAGGGRWRRRGQRRWAVAGGSGDGGRQRRQRTPQSAEASH